MRRHAPLGGPRAHPPQALPTPQHRGLFLLSLCSEAGPYATVLTTPVESLHVL